MPGHYGHGGKKKPKGGKKGGKKWEMANSPVDKGKDFVKSGMTLITEVNSDRYLKKSSDNKRNTGQTRWYNQRYLAPNLSSAGEKE